MEKIILDLVGIDRFNRPVFVDKKHNLFYCFTDKLYSHYAMDDLLRDIDDGSLLKSGDLTVKSGDMDGEPCKSVAKSRFELRIRKPMRPMRMVIFSDKDGLQDVLLPQKFVDGKMMEALFIDYDVEGVDEDQLVSINGSPALCSSLGVKFCEQKELDFYFNCRNSK